MASMGVDNSSVQAGKLTALVGLHSSHELSERSQWPRHDNSNINSITGGNVVARRHCQFSSEDET